MGGVAEEGGAAGPGPQDARVAFDAQVVGAARSSAWRSVSSAVLATWQPRASSIGA